MQYDKKFVMDRDEEFSMEILMEWIVRHKALCLRYLELKNLYESNHPILTESTDKPEYKPDNRLVVNFAKYIVDTFNGYFMGIPVKASHDNDSINERLQLIEAYNNIDDVNAETSKMCDIYGHAYGILFTDENAFPCTDVVSPLEGFIVYDNSIREKRLWGVRYTLDKDLRVVGSFSDSEKIYYFSENDKGEYVIDEEEQHYFGEVPMIEFIENEERQGAFESVETLIHAYNKSISEKANDVDYFADAYMKILGAELDEETVKALKNNRLINMVAPDTTNLVVEFMEKPSADTTQENLINRLEKLIFSISMVANITDEHFGNASGVSLRYKLQSMSNLANTKERKFVKSFTDRLRLFSNLPNSGISWEEASSVNFQFTRNIPSNLLEEAQTATALTGIVSDETALQVISIVDDVKTEVERIKEQNKPTETYDFEVMRDE